LRNWVEEGEFSENKLTETQVGSGREEVDEVKLEAEGSSIDWSWLYDVKPRDAEAVSERQGLIE
jgi:hypothetical protein